jgi:uncharacterized protein
MGDPHMAANLTTSSHPFPGLEVKPNPTGKPSLAFSRTGWALKAWSAPTPAKPNVPSRGLILLALGLLWLYRFALSPLLHTLYGPACRFEPSCSRFAADAIREQGLGRGAAMTLKRLARCHPLGGHGYDPVPAKGHSRKK